MTEQEQVKWANEWLLAWPKFARQYAAGGHSLMDLIADRFVGDLPWGPDSAGVLAAVRRHPQLGNIAEETARAFPGFDLLYHVSETEEAKAAEQ